MPEGKDPQRSGLKNLLLEVGAELEPVPEREEVFLQSLSTWWDRLKVTGARRAARDELWRAGRGSAAPHQYHSNSFSQLLWKDMAWCAVPQRALPLLWRSSQLAKKTVEQRGRQQEQAAKKSCPKTPPRSDNNRGTAKVLFLNIRTPLCLISNRVTALLGMK